jgi:phage-related protein
VNFPSPRGVHWARRFWICSTGRRRVARGAFELRVRDRDGIYRAFYALKFGDAVWVFHAFEKKTAKTPGHEIEIGAKRLREMLHEG